MLTFFKIILLFSLAQKASRVTLGLLIIITNQTVAKTLELTAERNEQTGWPLVLESPGIDFRPGKVSWKTDFLEKSPGKVLEKIIC